MVENPKWLKFDMTIHLGHIGICICTLLSTAALYYGLLNRINLVEQQAATQEREIAGIKQDYKSEIVALKDEMNRWFLRLDDKLDRKADKK